MSEKIVEKYKIIADEVEVEVQIKQGLMQANTYEVAIEEFKPATRALLAEIKQELITEVQVSTAEILDPKVLAKLKERFRKKALELITRHIPNIQRHRKDYLIGRLIQEMLGLGKIEFLLNDPQLEEIVINSIAEPVRVYHKKYGW